MRQYKLPNVLNQEEDYEKIYDQPDPAEGTVNVKKEEPLPAYYENEKEYMFYGDDVEFVRHHKRTSNNVHETLQELLDSQKQVIISNISHGLRVNINSVRLNKACSVVNAFYEISKISSLDLINQSILQATLEQNKKEITLYRDTLVGEFIRQQRENAQKQGNDSEEVSES